MPSPSYTWSDDMGNVSRDPALEQATRGAIISGCVFMDGIGEDQPLPRFNGGLFVKPANQAALDFAAAAMAGVTTATAVQSGTVLATAVTAAQVFRAAGGGITGWNALKAQLAASRAAGV